MRWRIKTLPRVGDKRRESRFAWRKTEVEGHIVWLEFYWIEYEYVQLHVDLATGTTHPERWSAGMPRLMYWY